MFKKTHKARYIRVVLKARTWKRAPMKLLKWKRKMTAKKQEYDLVTNDEFDTRIPLHPDEAFTYGITFEAKYIGTMDVPRPMSRVEIVAAMRRVRYEFKARGVKKRKVTVDVSIDGVRITTRSKSAGKRKTSTKFFGRKSSSTAEGSELMHHPIYRIFYVSHDSSDLKIFSYIARDGATNVFKCNVFKSNRKSSLVLYDTKGLLKKLRGSHRNKLNKINKYLGPSKKSQAMRIVRTVGQAFEVCHKMQVNSPDQPAPSTSSAADEAAPSVSDIAASKEADVLEVTTKAVVEEASGGRKEEQTRPSHLDLLPPPPRKEGKRSSPRSVPTPSINLPDLPECVTKVDVPTETGADTSTSLSAQHQLQLLKERLEQQAQQTQAAVAQLLLLRDQLAAEQAARCEAQARTHQLLVHNKELLEHIAALVAHLQDRERGVPRPISAQQLTLLPQKGDVGIRTNKSDTFSTSKGIRASASSDALIDLFTSTAQQNIENNNESRLSPYSVSPAPELVNGASSAPSFGGMSNEEIQNYLIAKFEDMGGFTDETSPKKFNANQQYYQNCNAFPNIPPLVNQFSAAELASVLEDDAFAVKTEAAPTQAMSVGHSENSLFSPSQDSSSKDSTPDECSSDEGGIPFIMPLSHKGTLTARGSDGRVRLIVPVSPAESSAEVCEAPAARPSPALLAVPAAAAPITRTTSEKVPNRSEMMTALRSQWTRHTTK